MIARTSICIGIVLALALGACASQAGRSGGGDNPPFGGPDSVGYAGELWETLAEAGLVGPGSIRHKPYVGQEPHGAILENFETDLTMGGHTSVVIVKKNYVGAGVSVDKVANNNRRYLDSVTVMYRRERGYDPDNKDWFWVKYNPDGSVQANPKGMKLAGRVAKGKPKGCIACHRGAVGGDYVYTHDRYTAY